jgi:hypothetical protein
MALGIADHVCSIGELVEAALAAVPALPTPTAPDRRRQFRVIEDSNSLAGFLSGKLTFFDHFYGTRVPVEEPSTASIADITAPS